jgi:ribosomal protein S18 acetylase RimI-like enzyme
MTLRIAPFDPRDARALVVMWRGSFEHGVGVKDPHSIDDQIEFLLKKIVPSKTVEVAWEGDRMVGFVAYDAESVAALYIRVDDIGRGLGSTLLARAKAASSGRLWLFAFQQNTRACAFYERQGFVAVARGFEPSWQLADVKYAWQRDAAVAAGNEGP